MKSITSLLAFFIALSVSAQLLRNETSFYNKIKGDTLFTLNDSAQVSLGNISDGWYEAQKVVLVEKSFWNDSDSSVSAGATIYDDDKHPIGKVKANFKTEASLIKTGRKYKKHLVVLLKGWVYNRNVHYKSIPEKGLEKIVNMKSRGGQSEIYREFFKTYNFKKSAAGDFSMYVYLDENATIEEEKPYRVIAIFRGETMLYCIVTNDKPFNIEKLKLKKEDGSGTYYFTSKPTDKIFEQLSDAVYSFIPL